MSTSANTAKIQFDLTNEAHETSGSKWVWVFAKYSKDPGAGSRVWSHVTLATSGHSTGGATSISIPSDQKGAFIDGSGTSVKLVWEYGTDGLSDTEAADADLRVKVFVIDMIKVPTASFELGELPPDAWGCPVNCGWQEGSCTCACGSPGSWTQTDSAFFSASLVNCNGTGYEKRIAYTVSSEDAISVGWIASGGDHSWNTGDLIYNKDQGGGDGSGPIPAAFPKGYQSFYFMEHELSQGQYRDFLNTLTRTQQASRVTANISADTISNYYVMTNGTSVQYRNGIRAPASGNGTTAPVVFGCDFDGDGTFDESSDGEWIAMNYIKWEDLLAYADWAGLRPMTELEYERAARGTKSATYAQYPWADSYFDGSNTLVEAIGDNPSFSTHCESGAHSALYDAGTVNERILGGCDSQNTTINFIANWNSDAGGPLRSGAYYGNGNSWNSAAITPEGYYGGYDLSGNLFEHVVSAGLADGRSFEGTSGDGALDASGNYTNTDWPAASGQGGRGGGWNDTVPAVNRIGNRNLAGGGAGANSRANDWGGRLARKTS